MPARDRLTPGRCVLARHHPLLKWLAVGASIPLMLSLVGLLGGINGWVLASLTLSTVTIALGIAANSGSTLTEAGVVRFRKGKLQLLEQGEVVHEVPRRDIAGGFSSGGPLVTFQLRGRLGTANEIHVGCDDSDHAESLLRRAKLSAVQRAVRLPLASVASQIPGCGLMAVLVAVPAVLVLLVVAAMLVFSVMNADAPTVMRLVPWLVGSLAVTWLLHRLTRARSVVVGTDGLVLQGMLRTRLVPLHQVRSLAECDAGVDVNLLDGTRERLPVRRTDPLFRSGETQEESDRRRTLKLRISQALAARGHAGIDPSALRQLERGDRSDDDWLAALRALTDAADYRRASWTRARLAAVVADPSMTAEHRIAAALALSGEADDALSSVATAARATADKRLAVALREAARGRVVESFTPGPRVSPREQRAEEEAQEEEAAAGEQPLKRRRR